MKIVAEIGLSHEGSLGTALRMVDACADAGVDAVKFQCHLGDPVSEFRPGTWFPQDFNRSRYWERTGFRMAGWDEIRLRCEKAGVLFGVSCFSIEAFELLDGFVGFWKVGSAQVSDVTLIDSMCRSGKPLVISSGMSDFKELQRALCNREFPGLTVLQCCSQYPTPPENVGLNVMQQLRDTFKCPVGLSDHSGTIYPGVIAAYLGADMLEVHVTLSRWSFGPDVTASLTIEELSQLVKGVRFAEQMKPVDKDAVASEMAEMRRLFRA